MTAIAPQNEVVANVESGEGPLADRGRRAWVSLGAVAAAALPAVLVLWDFGARPLRTALPSRLFSNFFDLQARALLDGQLHVPKGSLGLEAFVVDGRDYLYFGLFPALLRLPVAALTDDAWFGRWSAPSMLLAWVVLAALTSLLVWRVRAFVRPGVAVGRFELGLTAAFLTSTLGGSAVLSLLALPWVYSEALLWACTGSVAVAYFALGVLERPSVGRVLALAAAASAAALTRVTSAWAAAFVVIGVAALFSIAPSERERRPWAPALLAAGLVPLVIAIAANVAKFRHPWAIPFEDQVFTSLSSRRRRVLADGGVAGVRFLPSTLTAYFRPDGLRFSSVFPFITPPAEPAAEIGVELDMRYRTPSVLASMPFLVVLSAAGLVRVFRRRSPLGIRRLRVPLLGALAIPGGVLLVGYIHPRYLAEFLPGLIVAGAVGISVAVDLARRMPPRWRVLNGAALAALALFGGAAHLAIAGATARVNAGDRPLAAFVDTQRLLSDLTGRPLDALVSNGVQLPRSSKPDRVHIVGDCNGAFVGTGDLYAPWVPFEIPAQHLEIVFTSRTVGDRSPARLPIVTFTAGGYAVELRLDGFGNYRLVAVGADNGYFEGAWTPVVVGAAVEIDVSTDLLRQEILIDAPGHLYTGLPAALRDQDLLARPVVATVPPTSKADELGVDVRPTPPAASSLCRDLLASAS